MIISDVVTRLYSTLPLLTNAFSDQLTVSSASNSGSVSTIVFSGSHSLSTGNYIFVQAPIALTGISTITVSSEVATVVTSADHDLTYGYHTTATISGGHASINGSWTLLSVPNRRTFTVSMSAVGDGTYNTGTPVLQENRHSIEGWKQVTVTNSTTVTVASGYSGTYNYLTSGMTVHKGTRVAGAASFERAIEAYNKMSAGKLWAFCVLGKMTAARQYKRAISNTAVNSVASDYRQEMMQDFSVFLISPASASTLGRAERDASSTYASYVMRCLAGYALPSLFSNNSALTPAFIGHDFKLYNGAVYVHELVFEVPEAISREDLVDIEVTRAFRDIIYTQKNDYNIEVISSNLDLDDIPL